MHPLPRLRPRRTHTGTGGPAHQGCRRARSLTNEPSHSHRSCSHPIPCERVTFHRTQRPPGRRRAGHPKLGAAHSHASYIEALRKARLQFSIGSAPFAGAPGLPRRTVNRTLRSASSSDLRRQRLLDLFQYAPLYLLAVIRLNDDRVFRIIRIQIEISLVGRDHGNEIRV